MLRAAADGADDLARRAGELRMRVTAPRVEDYLTPAEAEDFRLLAFGYLQQAKAFARIVADQAEFPAMDALDPGTRSLGAALGLAAGLIQQDLSGSFVRAFEDVRLAREQLDRPLERDQVPPRLYRTLRESERSREGRLALRRGIERFQAGELQRAVLEAPEASDLRWAAKRIYAARSYDELRKDEDLTRTIARAPEDLEDAATATTDAVERAWYPAQTFIARVIGKTNTSTRGPYITAETVERVRRDVVRPGDVILERCDFYLSNTFLPGWWGHAALFVGDAHDMAVIGLAQDPVVRPHLAELASGKDLIEAVGEGVLVSSLARVMHADHIAVLRPHYGSTAALRRSIRAAFTHVGKAYDFNFDFETDDVLVCSELCWRALGDVIDAPLVKRFGRYTLTPDDLGKLSLPPQRQLELVAFLKAGKDSTREEFEALLK
jgi:hypothetical protein